MQRRSFLAGILGACAAPAYVKAGVLMPVRSIIVPDQRIIRWSRGPAEVVEFQDITTTLEEYLDWEAPGLQKMMRQQAEMTRELHAMIRNHHPVLVVPHITKWQRLTSTS